MEKEPEISALREQVRNLTAGIIRDAGKRMELARKIGEIKGKMGIEIRDEKVEQDIRNMVMQIADETGSSPEFALRLLNMLLEESEAVQARQPMRPQKKTHLGIFMRARELEAGGKSIIHLEVGEPDFMPPAAVGQSLSDSFHQKQYHYTETAGLTALRKAVAMKEGVAEQRIIVTPGGRFAIFAAIASLVKPGSELIVIEPAWPAYRECAEFVGARTRILSTSLGSRWSPDLDALQKMVSPATKMIVLNYPNNPTGKILDASTMDKIMSIAKEHDLYVLSDEVYSDYAYEMPFQSARAFGYDKTVVVSSFSKSYAMTGFRVGYAMAPEEIVKGMAKVQAVGITSVAEPMQRAALAALRESSAANVKEMKERMDYVCSRLKDMDMRFSVPDGALYAFPELIGTDGNSFVEKLLERGVAIAPGSGFGERYANHVRISACQPLGVLKQGLDTLAKALRGES